MVLQRIIPRPHERPDVEVLVDGNWCAGEVRMQTQLDDGTWELEVQYRLPGEHSSHIDTFTRERVREDRSTPACEDRRHGREENEA